MPRSALLPRLVFCAVVGVVALGRFTAQQAAGVYTAEQAQSGRALYDRNCAGCHGAGFEGSGDAPALAGGTFLLKWRPKMVSELFGLVLETMPPANPGSLDESAALNATAYILQRNGAQAGPLALRPGDTNQVGAIATGQAPSAVVPVQGRGGRRRAQSSATLAEPLTPSYPTAP
jgi:mono/diheme cytochrome c family protein